MPNATSMVVIKRKINPKKKKMSAIFSNLKIKTAFALRIDKNDKKQLAKNITMAVVVNSSIIEVALSLSTFSEVKTIKQRPKRLDEVFNI